MDQILNQIKQAAVGLSAEQISEQIMASQNADIVGDPVVMAEFMAAVAVADDPAMWEPDQAIPLDNAGND